MKRKFRIGHALIALVLLAAAALTALHHIRPGLEEYRRHAAPASTGEPGSVRAMWFGTTALFVSDGQHAVMIDPFFTRPPGMLPMLTNGKIAPDEKLITEWLQRAGIEKLDAVMVSHSHHDHSMDAGVVARLTGATLLGSESTLNIGRGAGLPEAQLRRVTSGEAMRYGSFDITFIESRHAGATGGKPTGEITQALKPPAHYFDYKLGGAYSILLRHAQGTVLHHGSAGFKPGALQGRSADVAFIGVSLLDDLPAYLREVVDATGARRVVPMHWDEFTRPLDQPLVPQVLLATNLPAFFRGMARRPDLKLQTLELGQPADVFTARGP